MSIDHLKTSALGDLTGRVALVTGSGTGIGLIIAKAYAANGAKVYITGRRLEVLQAVASQVPGLHPLQLDVTNKDSIRKAVAHVEANDKKLDILVNNAGLGAVGYQFITDRSLPENKTLGKSLFEADSFEVWQDAFKTNTFAAYFVTTAFLALLEAGAKSRGPKETSSVIIISSAVASRNLTFTSFSYGASKAAVEKIAKGLATEFVRNDIPVRVNVIAPGGFPSEILNLGSLEALDKFLEGPIPGGSHGTPAKRAGREPEIGLLAVYLSSSTGGFTNGAVVLLDGGHNLLNP